MGIGMVLDMASSVFPDGVAISSSEGEITNDDLRRRAAAGGRLVRRSGAKHLVFLGINSPALPVATFAAASAGIPIVPLNYRLGGDTLRDLVARVERPLIVADDAYVRHVDDIDAPLMTTAEFMAATAEGEGDELVDQPDDKVAVMLFTSGTTAAPKGVLLRHQHLLSYVLRTVEFGSAGDEDATLVSTPPYHIAGMGAVLSNLYAGRRMVYLADFSPEAWLRTIREEKVSSAMVVPTMLARVVEHLGTMPADVPSLRSLAYGGARMPRPVLERALTLFGDTGFVNAYGLTETSSTVTVLGPDDHREALMDATLRERLGSVGRPVPGMEIEIRDPDDEHVLDEGETGLLWVRGAQVSGEYLDQGSVLDAEGWFPTKDRARVVDGFLYIDGRADDTIIRGGENIAPSEIEDVLVQHPDIVELAVVGMPDDEWGERIVAAVVRRAGAELDEQTLREWCRTRLRGSRTPDQVVLVEELPRTDTGKFIRRDLVRRLNSTRTS